VKVATQEIENSQVVLDIEVEDERFEKAVDQAYRRIVNRINVPGFRKGKAPRALVERMVGREALVEDAVEKLVPEVVEAAVKEHDIKMVARPSLEIVSTEPLQVKATVPVQPKVELGDYRSLKIEREPVTVEDEQVDKVLERLRESNATWEPVERPIAQGDRVAIDLKGDVGETSLVDAKDAEYVVDPEGPEPAPGFAAELVGMEAGQERTFTLTLPEDYRNRELAGKSAEFSVKLHWVKERKLPELDDEFATTVGDEYETAAQLREAVHKQILDSEEATRARAHEDEVVQAVVDQSRVELPPQLIEEEAQRTLEQLASSLERQGIPIDQYLRFTNKSEAQLRSELTAQAERSVRRSEVLDAVAKAEEFEVTDDEIRAEVAGLDADAANSDRLLRTILASPTARERVASVIRQRKAARMLMHVVGGLPEEDATDTAEAETATAAEEPGDTSS
jgi:trigger factor